MESCHMEQALTNGSERNLIDRDQLIRDLNRLAPEQFDAVVNAVIMSQQTIKSRPSGRWILKDEFIDCSNCRREKWSRVPYENLVKGFKYCPKCGAKMEQEVNGNEDT